MSDLEVWHVALPVEELELTLAFYERLLGFVLVGRDEYPSKLQAFVAVRPGGFTLELFQPRGKAAEAPRRRPDHLAFECRDIRAYRAKLVERGLAVPEIEVFDNGVQTFTMQDPDGVALEFFQGRAIYEASISGTFYTEEAD